MDSGQNPISPMPGNGLNSAPQPTPTVPPVAPAPTAGPAPAASPAPSTTPASTAPAFTGTPAGPAPVFSAPQPSAPASPLGGLKSRRNRSSRPNGSNSMIAPAQPMTPTGDVIMDMPATKKPVMNKGLVISLIVIVIAIVAAVVVLVVFPKGGDGGSTSNNAINNPAFNRFANYMINGGDSTAPVAIADKTTQLEINIATPEARGDYLSTGNELLNAFVQEVNDSDSLKKYSNLVETVTALKDYYEVIYETYKITPLSYQSILKMYNSGGASSTENAINNHYQSLVSSKNEDVSKYASDMIESAKTQLEIFKKYSQHGCLHSGSVNSDCIKNINFSDIDTSKILGLEMEANSIQKSATNNIIGIISSINSMLHDRSDLNIQEVSNDRE